MVERKREEPTQPLLGPDFISRVQQRIGELAREMDGNTVLFRMGIPPKTETLRDRLKLAIDPSSYHYEEDRVTLARFREVVKKRKKGEKLTDQEQEVLLFGTLALILPAL